MFEAIGKVVFKTFVNVGANTRKIAVATKHGWNSVDVDAIHRKCDEPIRKPKEQPKSDLVDADFEVVS